MDPLPSPVPLETLLAHREWVRRVALALVRDENLAADLVQDVWVKALAKPPVVRGSIRGWLAAALRSTAADGFRSRASRERREQAVAKTERQPSAGDVVAEAEGLKRVVNAVMGLDEPYRSTVLLRYFRDEGPGAIAAAQGVPVETVRTRLKRAVASLRERLDKEGGGDGKAWRLALLPLVDSNGASPVPAPLPVPRESVPGVVALGGVLMSQKAVAAAVVVLAILAIAGGALWRGGNSGEGTSTASLPATPSPVAKPTTGTSPDPVPPGAPPDPGTGAPPPAPAEPKVDDAPPAGVFAQVFDESRKPVAGARARLALEGQPVAEAVTDAEGNFALPRLLAPKSGRYCLNVIVRDSQGRVARSTATGRAFGASVARGEFRLPILAMGDFVLRPGRVLDVRVLSGGRPVPGAFVHAEADFFGSDVRTDETPADSEGRIRVEDLWDGSWIVYARAPGTGRGRATAVVSSDSTGPIEVALTSRDVEVDVIHAGSGKPIEGATLEIGVAHDTPRWRERYVEESPPMEAAPTDSAGKTRIIGLGQDEALSIEVVLSGNEFPVQGVPTAYVAGGAASVRIEIPAPRSVRFPLARDRGVPPVEGSVVKVDGKNVRVEGGAIVVNDLPPKGDVDLTARAPDGSLARLRAKEGAGDEAAFFPPRTLTVTVKDEDGHPVNGSWVFVFDTDGNQMSRRTDPDAEGRTRIERLFAAECVVVAGATWDLGGGEVARVDLVDGDRSIDVVLGREFTVLARITVGGEKRLPGDLKCQAIYPHPWVGREGRETLKGEEDPVRAEVKYRVRSLRPGTPVRLWFQTGRYAPSRDVPPPPAGGEAVVDVELK